MASSPASAASAPGWRKLFTDPEASLGSLEAAFRQSTIQTDAKQIRIIMTIYIITMVVFIINDYQVFGLSHFFPVMIIVRAILIASAIFLLTNFSRISSFDTLDRLVFAGELVAVVLHLFIIYSRPASLTYFDLLLIVTFYLAIPNRFVYRLIPALLFSLGDFVLFWLLRPDPGGVGLLALGMALLVGNFIGLVTSTRLYLYRRNQFKAQHDESLARQKNEQLAAELRETNEELDQKVRERTAELAEANAALVKANRQLQELDQLKSGFLGVITHELRSPFVNINMSLQLIERYGLENLTIEQREQMRELNNGVQAARVMIDNLVKFATFLSKRGELSLAPVKLAEVVENALMPLHFQAQRKGVTLNAIIPEYLPTLRADPALLGEAIYHLTHNAVKFTSTGGEITLRARAKDSMLRFEVADTGAGIPAERLPTLWDSFSQMADPLLRGVEGLGLGLALVKYVVNAHGGEVWAESKAGVGSTFGFDLPINIVD